MKFEEMGSIGMDDMLSVCDTDNITAKKLLTLFLKTYSPLYELMWDSPYSQAVEQMAETWAEEGKDKKIYHYVSGFPNAICDAFLRFVAMCPNIHVTID